MGSPPHGSPSPLASGRRPVVDIYAHTRAGMLSAVSRRARYLVYASDSRGGGVYVIDPHSFRVIRYIRTGLVLQHVVPGWDLRLLYATNDASNSLTPIDPDTGRRAGPNIPVPDPYNLYLTPDGRHAIVVDEGKNTLSFRDPHTFALQKAVPVDCLGVDHMDFATRRIVAVWHVAGTPDMGSISPDGTILWVSSRFTGSVLAISTRTGRLIASIRAGVSPHGVCVWPQPGCYSIGHTGVMR